jgi:hypothetical protein
MYAFIQWLLGSQIERNFLLCYDHFNKRTSPVSQFMHHLTIVPEVQATEHRVER